MGSSGKISNIKRLRQILNAFVKHGLGDMVRILGLDTYVSIGKRMLLIKDTEEKVQYTSAQRMVMVFEELGPTFIKLGQILSTRKDQIPKEYITEFEKLQDNAISLPFETMNQVFLSESEKTTEEAFDYINKTPLASGSIGQVHEARLESGEEVVVKIRRPDIEHLINADIKILYFLAKQIKKMVLRDHETVNPVDIVREFEYVIKNELDFALEGRNLERFQHNFKDNPNVHFPDVYWEFTSTCVLVMENIKGIPIKNVEDLRKNGCNIRKITSNLFELTLKQMFFHSFFHADPHPGNFIIMEDDVIGVIDCGMVVALEEAFVNSFIDCFIGLFLKDYDMMVNGYLSIGTVTEDIDTPAFKNDLRNFAEHYIGVPLDSIGNISEVLDEGIAVAVRHNMKIPPHMLFTTKALILVEGTIKKIDPEFDVVGHSTQIAKDLIVKQKFDPKKIFRDTIKFFSGMANLVQTFPRQTSKILSMIEDEKVGMTLSIKNLEDLITVVKSLGSCISLSLISGGLAVGGSLVIQSKIPPLVFGASLFGLFGYAMALVLGIWVVILITLRVNR